MKNSKPTPAKGRAGLDKSHNPANQLSAMPGYSNGGMVKSKKGAMPMPMPMPMPAPGYANGGMVKGKKGSC